MNLLYELAPIKPAIIPINCVCVLANAGATSETSIPLSIATTAGDNNVVIINHETRPARPAVPSLSSDIPTATPIANKIPMLSINDPPALIKNAAPALFAPQPVGSIQ